MMQLVDNHLEMRGMMVVPQTVVAHPCQAWGPHKLQEGGPCQVELAQAGVEGLP